VKAKKKGEYWLNKKKCVSLKYSIIVLEDKTNHRKVTFTFLLFKDWKNWLLFYFYLSNFFGRYFYFYLSNFLASYLYFYLSTQTRYLLQHYNNTNASIRYIGFSRDKMSTDSGDCGVAEKGDQSVMYHKQGLPTLASRRTEICTSFFNNSVLKRNKTLAYITCCQGHVGKRWKNWGDPCHLFRRLPEPLDFSTLTWFMR